MFKKTLGIFSILIGIIMLLCNLKILDFGEMSKYVLSTLVMVIGVVGMIDKKKISFFYFILFLLGILSFTLTIGLIDKSLVNVYLVPLFLVVIGTRILVFGSMKKMKEERCCKLINCFLKPKKTVIEKPENVEVNAEKIVEAKPKPEKKPTVKKQTKPKPTTKKSVKKEDKSLKE